MTESSQPEAAVVVTIDDEGVSCRRPGGLVESVEWSDLRAVLLMTNSLGPFVCDVFWVLVGDDSGCVVPQGATGEQALLRRLQELPGFDNEAVIRAMSCTDDAKFLCWERPTL